MPRTPSSIAARTCRTMALERRRVGLRGERLGQGDHPDRQGHAGEASAIGRLAAVEPQDLGAAAADVDQQGRPGAGLDQRQTAQQRQLRLLLVRQDLELDPGGAADPGQELGAIERRGGRPRSRRSGP